MMFLGKEIGPYPFIVAELSCNHNGDMAQAKELIGAAKDAGADAVKIQIYTPDDMTIKSDKKDFIIKDGPWRGRNLYELYEKTQTTIEFAKEMVHEALKIEMPIFASIFSAKTLEKLIFPAYKIASFEITDLDLIQAVAKQGKPMVISTGAASDRDIWTALSYCVPDTIVLHCVSSYPTKITQANLWRIRYLQDRFTIPVGFSDHTQGFMAGGLAVAAGAVMLEKHLKLDDKSEDEEFSISPFEFKMYVERAKLAAEAMFETKQETYLRRSLYVVENIAKGNSFSDHNVRTIRPGYGLPPYRWTEVIGKTATQDLEAGTALKEEHVQW